MITLKPYHCYLKLRRLKEFKHILSQFRKNRSSFLLKISVFAQIMNPLTFKIFDSYFRLFREQKKIEKLATMSLHNNNNIMQFNNSLRPVILMEEISRKIMTAFIEINEMCVSSLTNQLPLLVPEPQIMSLPPKVSKEIVRESAAIIIGKQTQPPKSNKTVQELTKQISEPTKLTPQIIKSPLKSPEKQIDKNKTKRAQKQPKVKKDPLLPKKPLGPFLLYQADRKQQMLENNPNLRFAQISKMMGKDWQKVSPEIKSQYHEKFKTAKIKYEKEMKEYINTHPNYKKPERKRKTSKKEKESNQLKAKSMESGCQVSESQDELKQLSSFPPDSNQDSLGQFL